MKCKITHKHGPYFGLAWCFTMTLLSACTQVDDADQYVASINGQKISLNQFNVEIKNARLPDEHRDENKAKLLRKIIDRELFAQEAIKLNIDRTPEVVEAVNAAKSQIYAQAYLSKKLSKLMSPTESEVSSYISKHPEMFVHRKVFFTTDVIFTYDPNKIDIQMLQKNVSDLEALRKALEAQQIKYSMVNSNFSLEVLPVELVDKLKQVKVGDLLFSHDSTKAIVKSITNISEGPLPENIAKELAARIVFEDKKQQLINNEISRLRDFSKITVVNERLNSDNLARKTAVDAQN